MCYEYGRLLCLMPRGSFISYYAMKDSRPLYTAASRLTKLRSAGRGCDAVPFPTWRAEDGKDDFRFAALGGRAKSR